MEEKETKQFLRREKVLMLVMKTVTVRRERMRPELTPNITKLH